MCVKKSRREETKEAAGLGFPAASFVSRVRRSALVARPALDRRAPWKGKAGLLFWAEPEREPFSRRRACCPRLLPELLQQLVKPLLRAQGGERRVALDLRAVGEPLLDGERERPQPFALLAPRRVGAGEVEKDEGVVG